MDSVFNKRFGLWDLIFGTRPRFRTEEDLDDDDDDNDDHSDDENDDDQNTVNDDVRFQFTFYSNRFVNDLAK